ncbi:hypothetical protein E5161_06400 [Cohnella pontilimi]|uniref:NodB homology domain-containing protein n=1 Tax=Cohnella pontilimi TaxID=2564100 RepID=A0A4U0FF54_9BACL|nr:polysaccharide deacetylase family protein [Cohnella pontilimi]TJY43505.1 hypothetical protein E5161_06400 [Cohnella pontilimi]
MSSPFFLRLLLAAAWLVLASCSNSSPLPVNAPHSVPPEVSAAPTGDPVPQSPSPSPSPSKEPEVKAVPYHGPIEHIFFHPLILFPELAFDGDSITRVYDDWFVTVPEFQKMLTLLYERNYILVDIHSLYRLETVNGKLTAVQQPLSLPAGKKPLVLSIDDLNYYEYMRANGNAWRLVPDREDGVTAWARTPDGQEKSSREWEIVPLLDDFVKRHPDFSWQGAKGILALTGYEGVLGYRTNERESPNYKGEKAKALDMIQRLRKNGWTFASHTWGHMDVKKSSLARLKRDTARWKEEVGSLVGSTDVFVYPYGSSVAPEDPKLAFLRSQGFVVFCSVGPQPFLSFRDGMLRMDRRHIDGISLRTQRARLEPLFGNSPLLDPARPKIPTK